MSLADVRLLRQWEVREMQDMMNGVSSNTGKPPPGRLIEPDEWVDLTEGG